MTGEKSLRIILIGLLVYIASIVASFFGGIWVGRNMEQVRNPKADTTRVTVTDTIPYYHPVPKDSAVVRYVTRTLAGRPQDTVSAGKPQSTLSTQDSVAVEIPISQKAYETEDYRAYVSGYEPNLDSIFVNRRTVTETITVTKQKKSRLGFGVGIGAGYGIISKKPDIFVGGTLYMRLF